MPTIADDLGLTRDEWSMVRSMCGRCVSERNALEDLEQEAALRLFQKRDAYEALEGAARKNVIRRIVQNRLVDVSRASTPREAVGVGEDIASTAVVGDGAFRGETRRRAMERAVTSNFANRAQGRMAGVGSDVWEDIPAVAVGADAAQEAGAVLYVPLRPWVCVRHQWILRQLAEGKTTREMAADAKCSQRKIQRLVKGARKVVSEYWRPEG